MARSVTYSVVPRTKPGEKNMPPKYYAQAQARGDVSIRDMAERIQATCTVHKTDVYAVLIALEDVVKEAIQNGEIVRLGELCTLQVSLSGPERDHCFAPPSETPFERKSAVTMASESSEYVTVTSPLPSVEMSTSPIVEATATGTT